MCNYKAIVSLPDPKEGYPGLKDVYIHHCRYFVVTSLISNGCMIHCLLYWVIDSLFVRELMKDDAISRDGY